MRGQALSWGQLDGQRGSQRTEISGLEEPTGLDRRAVEGPQEERGQNQGGEMLFRSEALRGLEAGVWVVQSWAWRELGC